MKKAAFVSDNSKCGYKIGCVGVVEIAKSNRYGDIINENSNIKLVKANNKEFLLIKTFNETLPGEVYCQTKDNNGNKVCIREVENLKGKQFEKVCSIHAEVNLISQCAKYSISTKGMVLFLTNTPCYICAKAILVSGIAEVYYMAEHTDKRGIEFLKFNRIKLIKLDPFI